MTSNWRAALVTPPGVAAIAVIAVRGEAALESLGARIQLRRGKSLGDCQLGAIHVAEFIHDLGAKEEIVFTRIENDLFELQCHGGRQAADSILRSLAETGATVLTAEEWVQLEEECSLRAAAQIALSQVRTPQPTRVLLDQFRGALRSELCLAIAELEQNDPLSAHARLVELVARSRIGLRLVSGFRVSLLGRPNVGKSSLLNALLGYGRAIVLDEPGTTRDVLAAQAAFGGWPVTLHDLAGIRESSEPIESEGIRRARESASSADLVLLVSDASQPWSDAESALLSEFRDALLVHNKSDLPHDAESRPRGILLCAKTGAGLSDLEAVMLARLVQPKLAPGDAIPFTLPQTKAISRAAAFTKSGDLAQAKSELLRMQSTRAYAETN